MKTRTTAAIMSFGLLVASLPQSALALDLQRGQRLYNQRCAVCHGLNGVPVIQQAPSFVAKDRLMQADMVLLQRVQMGKNTCPPFMGVLKNEEILDVLNYARVLR
jgi:mono/diheme cytochrome c family protein